jgi:uncharacterized protein YceK
MAFRAICIALLCSSLPIVGCGTVANLATPGPEGGGKTPFGGVRQDVTCMKNAANGESPLGIRHEPGSQPHPQVAPLLFAAADLPLSFIGDVVTWPYTASYTWINQPIPVPPVLQPPVAPLPMLVPPETKQPEKKTPEKDANGGKPRDDMATPPPVPLPKGGV